MTNEELDRARVDEAWNQYNAGRTFDTVELIAARLAREGWTPPVAVDPDIAEARQIYHNSLPSDPMGMTLTGIKRGRALAAAEAKPGMVWVKHDGSDECPLTMDDFILIACKNRRLFIEWSGGSTWQEITHYAIITPPEDK